MRRVPHHNHAAQTVDAAYDVMQDAAFALVEGPPAQEGDVDWEEAAVVGQADSGDDGGALDEGEEDGGLSAYAAGAASAEQVLSSGSHHRLVQSVVTLQTDARPLTGRRLPEVTCRSSTTKVPSVTLKSPSAAQRLR